MTDEAKEENKIKNEQRTRYIALGIIFGSVVGVITDNVGLWIPLGLCLGAAFAETRAKAAASDTPSDQ